MPRDDFDDFEDEYDDEAEYDYDDNDDDDDDDSDDDDESPYDGYDGPYLGDADVDTGEHQPEWWQEDMPEEWWDYYDDSYEVVEWEIAIDY